MIALFFLTLSFSLQNGIKWEIVKRKTNIKYCYVFFPSFCMIRKVIYIIVTDVRFKPSCEGTVEVSCPPPMILSSPAALVPLPGSGSLRCWAVCLWGSCGPHLSSVPLSPGRTWSWRSSEPGSGPGPGSGPVPRGTRACCTGGCLQNLGVDDLCCSPCLPVESCSCPAPPVSPQSPLWSSGPLHSLSGPVPPQSQS